MSEPFDWNPFKGGSGEFVKFEAIGDEVVGTIVAIRTHTFDPAKGAVVLIDLDVGAEEPKTLSIDKVDLRQKVSALEPQIGDKLAVKYINNERTPNGTMKMFAVRHKAGERPAPKDEWDAPSDTGASVPIDDFSGYGEEPF